MMENKYGMISTSIVGNYTLDNPTSFTGKITWDLIGNISWDETSRRFSFWSRRWTPVDL
jgi:hypothetical protein